MRTNTTLAKSFICPCSLGQPAMWAISLSFPRKMQFSYIDDYIKNENFKQSNMIFIAEKCTPDLREIFHH
jgi:hypothetical protein